MVRDPLHPIRGIMMDRRHFLVQGSLGLMGLGLSRGLMAQSSILEDQPLRRLAFGSCNYSDRDQSHWRVIAQDTPELWIWLGDNIYGDGLTMVQRQKRYNDLKQNPYYAAFRASTPIIGTWDDHDYASDNKDGRFPDKLQSKYQFMDFMDLAGDERLLQRSGIYQSYNYGPAGQRTKVILLDLRYNQDQTRTHRVLLGDQQWSWFEAEVATADFDLLIIGSSFNVISPTTGFGLEGWKAFGGERQRLYNLLASLTCPTLLLSGDRHQSDISRVDPGNGRPVYEFMSSGLTHAAGLALPSPYRVSKVIGERNYGWVEIDWSGMVPRLQLAVRSPVSNKVLATVVV